MDILVSNAGGSRPLPIDASDAEWEEAMTLNFDRHITGIVLTVDGGMRNYSF